MIAVDNASKVYESTFNELMMYNHQELVEIAYFDYGLMFSDHDSKEFIASQCASIESDNFSK